MSEHDDPIVELRKTRDEHAKKFNYDIKAIMNDLREKEKNLGKKVVSLPPKPVLKGAG